jgi:hypothetical protein
LIADALLKDKARRAAAYWLEHCPQVLYAVRPDYVEAIEAEIDAAILAGETGLQITRRLQTWTAAIARWVAEIQARSERGETWKR